MWPGTLALAQHSLSPMEKIQRTMHTLEIGRAVVTYFLKLSLIALSVSPNLNRLELNKQAYIAIRFNHL